MVSQMWGGCSGLSKLYLKSHDQMYQTLKQCPMTSGHINGQFY